jgi:hypothetical protein
MPAWLKGALIGEAACVVFAAQLTLLLVLPLRQPPRDFHSIGAFARGVFSVTLFLGAAPAGVVGALAGLLAGRLRTWRGG